MRQPELKGARGSAGWGGPELAEGLSPGTGHPQAGKARPGCAEAWTAHGMRQDPPERGCRVWLGSSLGATSLIPAG